MKRSYKTLMIMPYLPLEGLIKFDGLSLWSYKKLSTKLITDVALRGHIDRLMACYQLYKGSQIQNPALVTTDFVNFPNPTRATIAKIEVLKNIMLFLGILENNSWSFITSDNFEVFYQRFNVGDDGLATQGGAIHRILSGGYKIGEIAFVKPEYINLPMGFHPDGAIYKALSDCTVNSVKSKDKSRVIQALNPLFAAYRNSHEQTWQSRILLLVMAFELLFGETERKNFRKNIQKFSRLGERTPLKTYKYPIINTETGKTMAEEQLTLNQIWAEEFYKLRHKIIHGNTVFSDDFIFRDLIKAVKPREPHFYIAVNFLVVCVLNKLREIGFSDVEHYIINPDAPKVFGGKIISGIKDELFKIESLSFYEALTRATTSSATT
ncbi:MAG: hypothetical protein UR68_C0005G0039 [Candidatus Roizmanbacteria bacterium GW2011_GWA2_35_19]|uniref:Uncharacterized protein n=2 Tax=Candidatus Roizmaniibacteriota TaxID=1752723 RepID=A0A0G0EDG7_9BACT|nr:MAG: hypothetical protein UR63_C0005G0023 [Candidatus Roizmanbacteria bacterium GW2011_GWC2_35_12]KKP73305.1 MAG: hypothetical protein UR68_C0005G0039 [Candidatus Roizmanbacteria bacterium GW2011_GWA2_35_19]